MTRVVYAIALGLVVAGCGSSKTPQAGGTTTTSDCVPAAGASTTTRLSPALQQRPTMYLTGVTAETHGCVERIVFDFRPGGAPGPGYDVSYQPASTAKIEDGSGNTLAIAGSAFLVVKLTPAMTAEMKGDKLEFTYTGPRRFKPSGARHVGEIVKTGDFESVVTWAIGLDAKRPFTATASKTQLVVEIS